MPKNAETPTLVAKKRYHHFSSLSTDPATRKYAPRCASVINPSIRSKFDQNALNGFSAKASARNTTNKNAPTPQRRADCFGRNCGCRSASKSQHAKTTSTIILNVKFFPVINGKNMDAVITSGTNGVQNTPIRASMSKVLSIVLIGGMVTGTGANDKLTEPVRAYH